MRRRTYIDADNKVKVNVKDSINGVRRYKRRIKRKRSYLREDPRCR